MYTLFLLPFRYKLVCILSSSAEYRRNIAVYGFIILNGLEAKSDKVLQHDRWHVFFVSKLRGKCLSEHIIVFVILSYLGINIQETRFPIANFFSWYRSTRFIEHALGARTGPLVSTCNIIAQHVVAGYGLISLPSTVRAILSSDVATRPLSDWEHF